MAGDDIKNTSGEELKMGLDFSHCDAHWGYGGFHVFRCRLAEQIGMTLNDMEGFGGVTEFNRFDDPILPLLDHSDCEGELSPAECRRVAPRLRELVKDWPNDDHDKQNALALAEGMESAAKSNESLCFW